MTEKVNTVGFKTLGCRLNQAEEESLRRQFMENGWLVSDTRSSKVVVLNTCSVTNQADSRTRKAVREVKKANPGSILVVMGCGVNAADGLPEVDLLIPNEQKREAFELIQKINTRNGVTRWSKIGSPQPKGFMTAGSRRTRALIKIQDGCNNFCAYCIVPYLRGREVSMPAQEALDEAKKLESLGYKELVLSGVNVGKYDSEGLDLTRFIKKLLQATNFPRIRLSSVNPQDISDEMIKLWASEARLCRHFHLSLQSGSTSMLKRMGRPYTTEEYLKLVNKIYKSIPDMAITTDVIVGFPGENEEEFRETMEFVKKVRFAKVHVFRYSKRTGTRAEKMVNQAPENTKKARSEELIKLSEKLHQKFVQRFLGQKIEVLFEEKKDKYWYGLSSNYIRVKYESKEGLANEFRDVALKQENLA